MSLQHQYDIKINGDNRGATTVCEVEGTIINYIRECNAKERRVGKKKEMSKEILMVNYVQK